MIITGYIQTTVDLLVYEAMTLNVSSQAFVLAAIGFQALSVVYSLWFGARSQHLLKRSGVGFC